MAYYGISKNLVTYLTKILHESKVNAARNSSAWSGACYLTPLFGAFLADTYWGKYRTVLTFLPIYILVRIEFVDAEAGLNSIIYPKNNSAQFALY